MSTAYAPQNLNPYSDGLTTGDVPGTAAIGGHFIRYIDDVVDAIEPYNTPFYSAIPKGSEVNQLAAEWLISVQRPHRLTLNTTMTNNQTTMVLTTGQGKYVHKYMVLRIQDSVTADEVVWVTAVDGTDTIATIVRGQGTTTGQVHTVSGTGQTVEVIGIAEPFTAVDHAPVGTIFGTWYVNYVQRWAGAIPMDNIERVTPNQEFKGDDQLLAKIRIEAQNQKLQLEKALLLGSKQIGTPASGVERPGMMGGIRAFLGTTSANATTVSGAVSLFDIESHTATVWNTYGDAVAKQIHVNMNTKRILSRLYNPVREGTFQEKSATLVLNKIELETGVFDLVTNRYMPDGEIWGIDLSGMELAPYKGHNWQVVDLSDANKGDYSTMAVRGAFTFLMKNEPKCWRISGFDTTLSNYPTANL